MQKVVKFMDICLQVAFSGVSGVEDDGVAVVPVLPDHPMDSAGHVEILHVDQSSRLSFRNNASIMV